MFLTDGQNYDPDPCSNCFWNFACWHHSRTRINTKIRYFCCSFQSVDDAMKVFSVLGSGWSLASQRAWKVKGRMAGLALSAPLAHRVPGAGARLAPLAAVAKNNPRCSCWAGESDGKNMSHWRIGFQRLSSESSHYFWANYLRPRVNKQPASARNTLCPQLQAVGCSPFCLFDVGWSASLVLKAGQFGGLRETDAVSWE